MNTLFSVLETATDVIVGVVVTGLAVVGINTPITPPSLTLLSTPPSIQLDESATISWNARNAVTCMSSDFDTKGAVSGNVVVFPPKTTTYTVTCSKVAEREFDSASFRDLRCLSGSRFCQRLNESGVKVPINSSGSQSRTQTTTKSVTVVVTPKSTAPTVTLTAEPNSIVAGKGQSILRWKSTNAEYCVSDLVNTLGAKAGNDTVSPETTTTYAVTCFGSGSSAKNTPGAPTSGTWQYQGQDISDMHAIFRGGTPTVDANSAYRGVPDCPVSNPAGKACSDFNACKMNTVNGFNVNSDIYVCVGGGGTQGTRAGTIPKTTASVTVNVLGGLPQCSDGVDNDNDGVKDAEDPQCRNGSGAGSGGGVGGGGVYDPNDNNEFPDPQCSDGIDNNNNGLVDFKGGDPACSSAFDVSEDVPEPAIFLTASGTLDNSNLVRKGNPAELTWGAKNVIADSCSLSGTNGDSFTLSGTSGKRSSSPLENEAIFTLSCLDLNEDPVSTSVTIKITFSIREN